MQLILARIKFSSYLEVKKSRNDKYYEEINEKIAKLVKENMSRRKHKTDQGKIMKD